VAAAAASQNRGRQSWARSIVGEIAADKEGRSFYWLSVSGAAAAIREGPACGGPKVDRKHKMERPPKWAGEKINKQINFSAQRDATHLGWTGGLGSSSICHTPGRPAHNWAPTGRGWPAASGHSQGAPSRSACSEWSAVDWLTSEAQLGGRRMGAVKIQPPSGVLPVCSVAATWTRPARRAMGADLRARVEAPFQCGELGALQTCTRT